MKRIIYLTVFFFFVTISHGQNIELGKYRLCHDMYWRCHFQNLLELKADSTYIFTYLDDTQMQIAKGTWKINSNFVILTPDTENRNTKVKKNHQDLVYQCLGTNRILIENGRMVVRFRDEENDKIKTEYFERVK